MNGATLGEYTSLFKEAGAWAIVVILGLAFWKGFWPFLKSQIASAQKQVEAAQSDNRLITAGFMAALERRDVEFGKVVSELSRLGAKIDSHHR